MSPTKIDNLAQDSTPDGATIYWWRDYAGKQSMRMFSDEKDESSDILAVNASELPVLPP